MKSIAERGRKRKALAETSLGRYLFVGFTGIPTPVIWGEAAHCDSFHKRGKIAVGNSTG